MAKTEIISLQISKEQKALIDRAAARLGKNRTAFILDAAHEAANQALLDQHVFLLNDEQWAQINHLLDNPPEPSEALKKVMSTPAPWDR